MKILFVENSGEAAYPLTEWLEDDGHEVLLAADCAVAQDFWDEADIDCLIVDLNMEPAGLKAEEIERTQGGLFTGWIWLKNYVFSQDESAKKRTIILTAYERDFKDRISSKERAGVKVISKKQGQGDVYEDILNSVSAIEKYLKNQAKNIEE